MSSQKSIYTHSTKLEKIENKIKKMHFEDNSCLRVIAEKIVTWRYKELEDEFKSLKFVISILKNEDVKWSKGQIRRALKYCYDPRYYYRADLKEIYELTEFEVDYLPQVPRKWKGISEWCYPEDETSENWHARRVRISSNDLSEEKYEFWGTREL